VGDRVSILALDGTMLGEGQVCKLYTPWGHCNVNSDIMVESVARQPVAANWGGATEFKQLVAGEKITWNSILCQTIKEKRR
jgi:hypothetical protein